MNWTDKPSELQFDFFTGRYEAVKGMELASSGKAASIWWFDADEWFEAKPIGFEFGADDLRKAIGVINTGANKNNGVGSWFSGKRKEGRIVSTGRYCRSEVVSRHANQNRIWRKVR